MKNIPKEKSLIYLFPEIAEEWHPTKNGNLSPMEVRGHSNKIVWWKCHICGADWEAMINARTRYNVTGCPKCTRKKANEKHHQTYLSKGKTIANSFPELAAEWDYEKNGDLTPEDVTPADHKIVWWKCKRCGHSWKARISNRAYLGNGCQNCAKRFRSSFPEQAIYYYIKQVYADTIASDHHLNVELDIYVPSKNIAIEYDGLQWHKETDRIKSDNYKNSVCIENQVHLYRVREIGNEDLELQDNEYITIIPCERKNDESLKKAIIRLLQEICAGCDIDIDLTRDRGKIKSLYIENIDQSSLSETDPLIAAEWDYERNYPFTPDKITRGSDDKFFWICPKCSRSYEASISHRTLDHTGCPYCSKQIVIPGVTDLETWCIDNNKEYLLKEWDYEKNIGLSPKTVFKGSNKKVWWKCSICGHEWKAALYSRTGKNRNGCPNCKEANRTYNHRKKIINLNTGEIFDSIKEAAKKNDCSTNLLQMCLRGQIKTAMGYHWDYYSEGIDYSTNEWYMQPQGKHNKSK